MVNNALEASLAFQLGPELQSHLNPIGDQVHVDAGTIFFRQGTACDGVYLLRTGNARIFMLDEHQHLVTSREVGPGCILGLPAALCVQPHMFSAETRDNCTFSHIAPATLQQFLRVHPELCMQVLQLMSSELALVNQRREELSKCTQTTCSLRPSCSSKPH